jgi:aminomethyltransferase
MRAALLHFPLPHPMALHAPTWRLCRFSVIENLYEVAVSSVENLLKTPLHSWHVANHGRMVEFAGWSMPVQYGSIIDEHHQTRKSVGMFDVSHMGRFYFSGTQVDEFLDRFTTRRVARVEPGKIRYSLMTNESGGILDDVLVYHLPALDGEPFHMMVVNASNRAKIVDWLRSKSDGEVQMDDRTTQTAMIAVQGPLANQVVAKISEIDPETLPYYTGTTTKVLGNPTIVSRTGYTGEDGCELIVAANEAIDVWTKVFELAQEIGGGATGLAARDTLRLEAGMPLYGHELNEDINPAQADLKFAINLKDREFFGRSAILAAKKDSSLPIRIGLELEGRRAAREECEIFLGEQRVGYVTSGTFAPTIQKSISMGYMLPEFAKPGTELTVDIRGKSHFAKVVDLPFYSRNK